MTIPGWQPTQLVLDQQDPRFDPLILFKQFKRYIRKKVCSDGHYWFTHYDLRNWIYRKTKDDPLSNKAARDLSVIWEVLGLIRPEQKPFGPPSLSFGQWTWEIWVFVEGAKK